jgi:hypothetical protein
MHKVGHASSAVALFLVTAQLAVAEPVDHEMVTRIRYEGLQRSQVMDTLRGLTDGFGARLTASPAQREASTWAEARFRSWGLVNAHEEPFEFGEGWTFSECHVRAMAPFQGPLRALPLAWTIGTDGPRRGLATKAKLAGEQDFEALRGKLRGKILFIEPSVPARTLPDPSEERPYKRYDEAGLRDIATYPVAAQAEPTFLDRTRGRWAFLDARNRFLVEEGALATVERSVRPAGIVWVTGGGGGGWPGRSRGVPGLSMSVDHFDRIARALEDGKRVELEVEVAANFHRGDTPVGNVFAEIPGTGRDGEIVMASAHLDSWHTGTGATDNGAGVAVVMEAARILAALGVKPRRTIRFALWSGEEQGTIGSYTYVRNNVATRPPPESADQRALPEFLWPPTWPITPKAAHARYSAVFNLDSGSGRIRGIHAQGNAAVAPIFRAWLEPFADLGATVVTLRSEPASDHARFDDVGVPGFMFLQDELEYRTRTWHTDLDTLNHVSREDLMQAATIMASFLYHAAVRPDRLPRKPLPQAPHSSPPAPAPAPAPTSATRASGGAKVGGTGVAGPPHT